MEVKRSHGTNHSHNKAPDQLNVLADQSASKAPPTLLERLEAQITQHKSDLATPVSVEQIQQALQDEQWEVRSTAIEQLSARDAIEVFPLLAQAFHDEHRFVRMATLHVLAHKEDTLISRSMLARGLHDDDWQVREVAVQVLGLLGTPTCLELVQPALQDENTEVRDAAKFALRWNSTNEEIPVLYRHLWEKKAMHEQLHDMKRSKRNDSDSTSGMPLPTTLYENSYASHSVQEQMLGYAAREYAQQDHTQEATPPDEYGDVMSSSREKVTSYRSRSNSRKRWWTLVASAAVVFFMLGHFTTSLIPQFGLPVNKTNIVVHSPYIDPAAPTATPIFDENSPYALNNIYAAIIIQNELAIGLNVAPRQLIKQMKQHGSLAALAAAQGVSATQLKAIELNAALNSLETMKTESYYDPQPSPQFTTFEQHLRNDQLFLVDTINNSLASCTKDYCFLV
jgi:HEAT repeats